MSGNAWTEPTERLTLSAEKKAFLKISFPVAFTQPVRLACKGRFGKPKHGWVWERTMSVLPRSPRTYTSSINALR